MTEWSRVEFDRILREKLDSFRAQCQAAGLTDRRRVPDPGKCVVCSSLIPPRWEEKPFGHWVTASQACQVCVNERDRESQEIEFSKRIAAAQIPARLQGLRLDQLERDRTNSKLAQACHEWDGRRWIIASGGVGTGKTSWLTALLIESLVRSPAGGPSMWTTEQRFFRMAQIRSERSRTGREEIIQRAIDARILMIDDLGAGRRDLTEWQGGAMRELLMERHLEGRSTLITTNLSAEAISHSYGEHIASRMNEAGGFINLGGADRRRRSSSSWLRFWGR